MKKLKRPMTIGLLGHQGHGKTALSVVLDMIMGWGSYRQGCMCYSHPDRMNQSYIAHHEYYMGHHENVPKHLAL